MSGFVVWMTGLSGAGKSTLASLLTQELSMRGVHVECLDGDEVRKNLSHGLGFSREDRDRNIRRIGYVARMVARSGACAITAAISPYKALRDEIRSKTENFLEVYCECPLDVLTERDPKGLYKRALAGELKNFTGVDDPYEAPVDPEVHLHTDKAGPEECVQEIISVLEERGLLHQQTQLAGLPPPFGGEVFEARKASEDELRALGTSIEVSESLRQNVRAVAKGYFSPVCGFMTQREAVKVEKSSALERGTPWWEAPFVLPLPSGSAVEPGTSIALESGGERFAICRVDQIWNDGEDGQAMGAGPIEAVGPGNDDGETARAIRRLARERGAGQLCLLAASKAPEERSQGRFETAVALSDHVVVAVPPHAVEAWRPIVGSRGSLVVVPEDFPLANLRALAVVQKSLGTRACLQLDV
jgi:sulfate adenylyltransferase/3'-phosphoadenosine 5'-phosphosulfate synthase